MLNLRKIDVFWVKAHFLFIKHWKKMECQWNIFYLSINATTIWWTSLSLLLFWHRLFSLSVHFVTNFVWDSCVWKWRSIGFFLLIFQFEWDFEWLFLFDAHTTQIQVRGFYASFMAMCLFCQISDLSVYIILKVATKNIFSA